MHPSARSLLNRLALSLVLLTALPVSANQRADEAMIEDLMVSSGLIQQIQRLPQAYMAFVDQVFVGLERQRHPVPKSLQQHIRQSFAHALMPERIESEIRSRLVLGLPQETMLATLTWLQSDLGKKVTAVELNAGSAVNSIELTTFVLQLQLERPSPERLQLARRIEDITQGSELAAEAWETVVVAIARAIEADLVNKGPQRIEKLQEYLDSVRSNIKAVLQQGRLLQVLFTYRALTDDELTQYVEFLEAPTGREMTKVVNGALQAAAINALQKMQLGPLNSAKPEGDKA